MCQGISGNVKLPVLNYARFDVNRHWVAVCLLISELHL